MDTTPGTTQDNEITLDDEISLEVESTTENNAAAKDDGTTGRRKLDRWIEKLLDTGKRNNLINFKDAKYTTAELVVPSVEEVFSKCEVGHTFDVYDPKIEDEFDENETSDGETSSDDSTQPESTQNDAPEGGDASDESAPDASVSDENASDSSADESSPVESAAPDDASGDAPSPTKVAAEKAQSSRKEEYLKRFASKVNSRSLLFYSAKIGPIAALRGVAKKARELQEETGVSAAYLAFGFVRWNDKKDPSVFYRAPILLVHVDVLTGSVVEPVKIQINDDDVVVNPTFSYKLQTEHGASLPPFEDDDTLETYLAKVAEIVGKLGWEIVRECKLGIFSFLKLAMYEDLKTNADRILQNNVVRALVGLGGSETPQEQTPRLANPLLELHTVVDADSSQMEAVEMAKSGKSFVLQGPPGTGKSQTITNMIAECLYDGKKVLFVSEKQAALNVVFNKLDKVGLEDFCLELHSFKANKKAVIEELVQTLETPRSSVAANAEEEIRQKKDALQKLDAHVEALHKKREPLGQSVFQLIERYSELRNTPDVDFSIADVLSKGSDYLLESTRLLDEYAAYAPDVGDDYRQNAWFGFAAQNLDFDQKNRLKSDVATLAQNWDALSPVFATLREKYGTKESSLAEARSLQKLLAFLAEPDVVAPSNFIDGDFAELVANVDARLEEGNAIRALKDKLSETFSETLFGAGLDGNDLTFQFAVKFKSFFSRLFSADYRKLVEKLQPHMKNPGALKYKDAKEAAERLKELQEASRSFEGNAKGVKLVLGASGDASSAECRERRAAFKKDADELASKIKPVDDVVDRVAAQFDAGVFSFEKTSLDECRQKLTGILENFDKLGAWLNFSGVLRQLDAASLRAFVDAALVKGVKSGETSDAFRKVFYRRWLEGAIAADPELSSFTRVRQDQAVDVFAKKDGTQYDISKVQIRAELSRKRPNLDLIAGGGSVAFLRREGQKKRKQASVRKLLAEAGELIQTLKPCFLMSPLSVSSLLDPDKIKFDVVIFDEASQVFPQDALGAIYRAKQLIVVGDSKQMPPTNFFNAAIESSDDDEDDDVADFESILDVCGAAFPSKRLSWHYRSRYEQLIAFSNVHFYDGTLATFPSATIDRGADGIGVDHYYVEGGVFDRKTKTNLEEAKRVVELVFDNIKKYPDRSLGVVAFSNAQQKLIDRLISKERERDPSFESFFRMDAAEPFFVKNLETVQGDERDAIIFSVAYAKGSDGRFIQNFGPLNREGGERRLNVAITRAKKNVQLVSSIRHADINLSGTKSVGVKLLRDYLNYAQNGEATLERPAPAGTKEERLDALEKEIAEFLRANDYVVDLGIGCSDRLVDMGVKASDDSDYFMAIECDGETYRSFNNARDRDVTRRSVLKGMGWTYYRVWSPEWFKNKEAEKERLLKAVKDAVAKAQGAAEKKPKAAEAPVKTPVVEPAPEKPSTPTTTSEPVAVPAEAPATTSAPAPTPTVADAPKALNDFEIADQEPSGGFEEYRQVDALEIIKKHGAYFKNAIKEILQTEGPLAEDALLKRIAPFFGGKSISKTVVNEFDIRMVICEKEGIIRRDGFLYLQDQESVKLRVPGVKRDVKLIALEELADGILTLVEENAPIEKDGLYKTLAKLLGATKTAAVVERFDKGLALLIEKGSVAEADGILRPTKTAR